MGQGARRGVKRGQECLPLCSTKTERSPVGKSFVGACQSAFQDEFAHRAMRDRRRRLQGAFCVACQAQIEFLRTCGVRWHDITFV